MSAGTREHYTLSGQMETTLKIMIVGTFVTFQGTMAPVHEKEVTTVGGPVGANVEGNDVVGPTDGEEDMGPRVGTKVVGSVGYDEVELTEGAEDTGLRVGSKVLGNVGNDEVGSKVGFAVVPTGPGTEM